MKIASLDIWFLKSADAHEAHTAAVIQLNERIERENLDVMNVETITEPVFLGLGVRQIGLRVWHRTN